MRLRGKLMKDDDGMLCIKMQIAPGNPNLENIPLEEILEDMMDQNVVIDVFPLTKRWEGTDE
jgi:hypothetical protein